MLRNDHGKQLAEFLLQMNKYEQRFHNRDNESSLDDTDLLENSNTSQDMDREH
jgi:hypothetical protein